jgi:hypothetical protein
MKSFILVYILWPKTVDLVVKLRFSVAQSINRLIIGPLIHLHVHDCSYELPVCNPAIDLER